MKVLIAAGGTAGHINPALAIADEIRARQPDAEILFAGRREGMEGTLVPKAGYPFVHIEVRGFQRRLSLTNIRRNLAAIWYLALSGPAAKKIIRDFSPDLCIGTGGYVSGPIVRAAAKCGVRTAIHEQNAFPGVTNKLLAKEVDLVLSATKGAVERLEAPEKTHVVGNPVRAAVFHQDAAACKQAVHAEGRTVLLSFGGSLGAAPLNEAAAALAQWHLKNRDLLHIHATGKAGKEPFAALLKEKGIAPGKNLVVKEYIDDMPAMLAAADLVISRAGALTISELTAAGRASILIPSPYVAENHQYYNALELEKAGAAIVVEEKELTDQKLIDLVEKLTADPAALRRMGQSAAAMAVPDSAQRICDLLLGLF